MLMETADGEGNVKSKKGSVIISAANLQLTPITALESKNVNMTVAQQ